MIKKITGLWGFKKGGEMLFCCKLKDPNFPFEQDNDLLAGYLSAFYYFSKDILHDPIHCFTTKYYHYCIIKKNKLLFAGRFPNSELDNSLPSKLDNLVSLFLEKPEEILRGFKYNETSILELKNVLNSSILQ